MCLSARPLDDGMASPDEPHADIHTIVQWIRAGASDVIAEERWQENARQRFGGTDGRRARWPGALAAVRACVSTLADRWRPVDVEAATGRSRRCERTRRT